MTDVGPVVKRRACPLSLGASLVLAAALSGCATAPSHDAVAKFAAAADATAENTRSAFALVEQTSRMATVETRDNDYLTSPAKVTLGPIDTQLSADILEPRLRVLEGLSAYASLLLALTSGDQQTAFDKNAQAVGESLKTVNVKDFKIPPETADAVTKALTALGDFLIQEKLDRKLPPIIRRMDPTVSTLTDALIQDIGSPGDAQGKGAGGLRQIIASNLRLYRVARQQNLIEIAAAPGTPGGTTRLELYREYKLAVEEMNKVDTLDASLAALQSALAKMKLAHAALVAPKNPSTLQKVESFANQAERVGKLADTLRKL